jgi:hypothetical protein
MKFKVGGGQFIVSGEIGNRQSAFGIRPATANGDYKDSGAIVFWKLLVNPQRARRYTQEFRATAF